MKENIKENSGNQVIQLILMVLVLSMVILLELSFLKEYIIYKKIEERKEFSEEEMRNLAVSNELVDYLKQKQIGKEELIRQLTIRGLLYNLDLTKVENVQKNPLSLKYQKRIEQIPNYKRVYNLYSIIFTDLQVFPIPIDVEHGESVDFENSWMEERSYGGKRGHEGTDLIPSIDQINYFPVISVSDGVVEKKGWLEQGGYRIGVRSKSGCYFYYAHLSRYSPELEEGSTVKAGQVLGYMGNSGYGVEGTTGQFVTHLHFGIYINEEEREVSVNPYWVLKYLEKYKVEMRYSEVSF